ncbi:endo-1,4-beta-xylanase [Teredinibacter turnerae]|uniref:endo-1,4-beta-xylanase n=1 Tax=Teredinibacter turnerae TaxID=2426 RepID=UPI0003801DBC|nr:endo-1,4-beta-xylanase [Teredinibacter turnerae]
MKIAHLSVLAAVLASSSALAVSQDVRPANCGFSLATGTDSVWESGYQAWTHLTNESGETATDFEIFYRLANSAITESMQAEYRAVDGGYILSAPEWLRYQTIPRGTGYRLGYISEGVFDSAVTPYVLSINGNPCDTDLPVVSLSANQTVFTSAGTLTLNADAEDNVAVNKVVFKQNGEVIAEDYNAPYTFSMPIDASMNGKFAFTATAVDMNGNEATAASKPVFAKVGARFLGSAASSDKSFAAMSPYFQQLTPENAGKWGSVEAVRDVMDWSGMDKAYTYSREKGIPMKLHTLVWGQQAPSWIDNLSPAEQLAEVEEWYAALASRYPDAEMIDVVNEALHAPATFRDALGGDGETGWDWVIRSFELAREYFPDSELLINDYNILILEAYTAEYLEIIELLQARGLLDGIGLQSHFLERADLAIVQANVETLAATGLPIYITELDVDFADDARHAQRLAGLFEIFWDNPSVVGVTHWGHLRGEMWRENGYLIDRDGSLRAGMSWILCYSTGDTDCVLPEYVPAGWKGTPEGLTLEAEMYDDAVGLAVLGENIGYTDGGDWFSYAKVNFEPTWDTFAVGYAKGMDTETSLSVHLDSLDSPAIASIDMPSSGDWSTVKELIVDIPAVAGEHDVFFRFNGSYGGGNVDYVRFGLPAGLGEELMPNGDFEDSTASGWYTWGGGVVSTQIARVFNGSYSLQVAEREGNAPAAYDISSLVAAGGTYTLSLAAAITGEVTADVNVTLSTVCGDQTAYSWIVNPTMLVDGEWQELTSEFSIPDCDFAGAQLIVEGPGAGVALLLDNVSLRSLDAGVSSGLLVNGTFENASTEGWFTWSGALNVTSDIVYDGSYAMALTDRESTDSPAATSLLGLLSPGLTYSTSLALLVRGADSSDLQLVLKTSCDGEDVYSWIANAEGVAADEWFTLAGEITVPDCELTDLMMYVQGPSGGAEIYLDNVQVN